MVGCLNCKHQIKNEGRNSSSIFQDPTNEYLKKNKTALQIIDTLKQYFGVNSVMKIPSKYPSFYGGHYIDDDGSLVILIVGDTIKGKKEIKKIVYTNKFKIKTGKYSYETLSNIMDKLDSIKLHKYKQPFSNNIISWGLHIKDNCIKVELKESNPIKIKEFKNHILDSPAIKFQ